jgi:hypothetical protein
MLNVVRILFIAVIALLLVACERSADSPTAPAPTTSAKAVYRTPAQPSQAFLTSLLAAYETTEWERVEFQEVTRGGSQIAYPRSFPHGEFLQLTVNLQRGGPREVPPVEVYVPKTMQTAPNRAIVFKFDGTVAGAEYVISTFLPVWFDELDLGAYHHTYELATLEDGTTLHAKGITRYDTPPTPWSTAPVQFTLLPHDPTVTEVAKQVLDPGEPGDN